MLRRYSRGSRGGSTELNQKAESGGCWYSAHALLIQSRIPAQGMVLLTVSHRVFPPLLIKTSLTGIARGHLPSPKSF